MKFHANDQIGSYRLVRELGHGGMGTVYEVVHEETGARRALKVFTLDHGNREFLRKRFLAEAKILAKLESPHLVKVHELAIDEDGLTPYFVMDLVLGARGEPETLEDVRRAGKVTESAALRWYEDLRQGLAYIHSQGVVHRDVKLENVLVDAAGHAVLSDFGVSRIFGDRMRSELMVTTTFIAGVTTGTKPVMGTYWYLAPEIRRGGDASPASDWYSLGVLMYRLLTGMWYEPNTKAFDLLLPFSRKCQRTVRRLLSDDPAERCPLPTVPDASSCRGLGRFWIASVSLGVIGSIALLRHLSSPTPSSPSPTLFSAATSSPLHYCKDADFAFCPCPAGTNAYCNLSVAVTYPYWLAKTPVTRRQWFAVRGEPLKAWAGGGDVPMTYVTREEVTDFCARLNARFAAQLPRDCEIRLPTVAEWRLAYVVGRTVTNVLTTGRHDQRRANCEIGWFGQGVNGEAGRSDMKRYYEDLNLPVPMVTNIWPEFPLQRIDSHDANWVRYSSQFAPVPVGLKPANALGLRDLYGNCFEMAYDRGSTNEQRWGGSEFGLRTGNLYPGLGLFVTNPVASHGSHPLMLGTYITPDLLGDEVWVAPFDRLPHLGFRLCIGPKLSRP